MTTKREFEVRTHMFAALASIGITHDDAKSLRRISSGLRSWFERECGTDHGHIERDDDTQKPYWLSSASGKRYRIRDMESGALTRLAEIMKKYPSLTAYVQGDPRGAALYILRPGDVPAGKQVDGYYTRGICIY